MNEFLEMNAAFARPPHRSRILDRDLNRYWISTAADHVRRRGYTLHLLTACIKDRAAGEPAFRNLHWTHVRDCLLGRDVDFADPISLDSHVRALVGTPLVALAN